METLAGKRIVITRSWEDYEAAAEAIRRRGGIPIACPTISLHPPEDCEPLDRAIQSIQNFDWIFFTSAHAAQFFLERLFSKSIRLPDSVQCAAIGPATAAAVAQRGVRSSFIAKTATGRSLVREFNEVHPIQGKRFLLPLSNMARDEVNNSLREAGGAVTAVTAYRTIPAETFPREVGDFLRKNAVDWVTFFSSSAAANFYQILQRNPNYPACFHIASIGPSTSETLRQIGATPDVEAVPHTLEGLLDAMTAFYQETI